jgi:Fe-S-cluster containining protein
VSAARQVLRIFQDIDDNTAHFQERTRLACPEGCGACCENAQVRATVVELMPLALHLHSQGAAQETLVRAEAGHGAWCIFYQQRAPGQGRCGAYPWRPAICRLFGFAGIRTRRGDLELATCWKHRETQPDVVDAAEQALEMPVFSDVERAIQKVHPELGRVQLPINDALKAALELAVRTAR